MKTNMLTIDSPRFMKIDIINADNQQKIQQLNSWYHEPDEMRHVLSDIIGQSIDETVEIRLPFYSDYGRNIHLGKHIFINSGVMLTDLGGITIDDHALIGPGAMIISVNHPQSPDKRRNLELTPVHICENAWIGARATILPGVTVGKNAIVAAGAVVTHDVKPNTIVAGVPARFLKTVD